MTFNSKKEKLIFYNLPVILFILLPFFLITGPFLSDLSVSLICLIFLTYCTKKKNFKYFQNKFFYIFLIFYAYLITITLIYNFNKDSLGTAFVFVRYGIFVIAIIALLQTNDKFIKYFFYCILICFTALVFDGFYQYFFEENVLGFKSGRYDRVSSFFHDEQILGSYLCRLWPIFFGLSILIFKNKSKLFFFFILIFILSETLIFLSGERTAFFLINLSALFVILFSQKLLKVRLLTLLSTILLLGIISSINPTAKERVIDNTLKGMNLIDNKTDDQFYIFTKARHEMYISSYKMFLDNKIAGIGIKNYRKKCNDPKYFVNKEKKCSTHPHNTYIQLLAETGIVGFLFLLSVFIYFCVNIFKHLIFKFRGKIYFNDFEICILSGIIIFLWPFVPTFNFFNNWLMIISIINLPFLFWSINSRIHND